MRDGVICGLVAVGVIVAVIALPGLLSLAGIGPSSQWEDPDWIAARCRVYANHLSDGKLSLYEEVQYQHDCNKDH